MTKRELIEKVALAWKIQRLRRDPMLDDVAVALNSVATWEEKQHVERMWELFEKAGCKMPEETQDVRAVLTSMRRYHEASPHVAAILDELEERLKRTEKSDGKV